MRGPEIADMTTETVEMVWLIEKKCFSTPWSLASLASELSNANAVFRTARLDGEIVGYAGMHHIVDEGYITNIAVLPDFRRSGIAGALIRNLLGYAGDNKLSMLTLEVRESNAAAVALYDGFGFEKVGKRKNFYKAPDEDGIIMTKTLIL